MVKNLDSEEKQSIGQQQAEGASGKPSQTRLTSGNVGEAEDGLSESDIVICILETNV